MTDYSGPYDYNDDPKHLVFTLARYKWVAKMLHGKGRVLEVGCGDGWKSRIVRQSVYHLTAIDGDKKLIANAVSDPRWPIEFRCADAVRGDYRLFDEEGQWRPYDAVFSLDLFEHIEEGEKLLRRFRSSAPVCIIGTPSIESQIYASPRSKAHHINCKSGEELRQLCLEHWRQVFMFGMNDEVVHTGFLPMSHYLLALCIE